MNGWLGDQGIATAMLFLITTYGHDFIATFTRVGSIEYIWYIAIYVLYEVAPSAWRTLEHMVRAEGSDGIVAMPSTDRIRRMEAKLDEMIERLQDRDPQLWAIVFA